MVTGKIADLDKLLSNIKAAYVKKQQLLPVHEKRKVGESMKKLTTELQQRTSTLRKLIEEHQKQKKREEEMSKHVGTSKIADNSGEFSAPTLGGGGSVTSSRADRLEAERLKRKNSARTRNRETTNRDRPSISSRRTRAETN